MIPEAALQAAGPDAHLVRRPVGVLHVYVGPLTPSGYVPSRGRTVCRARTRRLAAHHERCSSLAPPTPGRRRVCARCSVRLSSNLARRAEAPCVHRDDYRRRYADLTLRDLWVQAVMAETLDELVAVAHLSLVLHGHSACEHQLPADLRRYEHLRAPRTFTDLLGALREQLAGYPNARRHRRDVDSLLDAQARERAARHEQWLAKQTHDGRMAYRP